MAFFSRVDKKILVTLVVLVALLALILLADFVVFEYAPSSATKVQNSAGGAQTQLKP